jgi:hypothetical protein
MNSGQTKPIFFDMMGRLKHAQKKRELKAAFRRNPKPAKVRIQDTDVPYVEKPKDWRNQYVPDCCFYATLIVANSCGLLYNTI